MEYVLYGRCKYFERTLHPRLGLMSVGSMEQVFGDHVARWIETSQAALCMRCQQIEASGYATAMAADRADEGGSHCFL